MGIRNHVKGRSDHLEHLGALVRIGGHTDAEAWLVDELPQGIQEIDLTDCRREFRQLQQAA